MAGAEDRQRLIPNLGENLIFAGYLSPMQEVHASTEAIHNKRRRDHEK